MMSETTTLEGNKYTFWKLLSEYKIEIPIIQRDYAQGRESASAIRKELLESIYKALMEENCLDFDFVYGSAEELIGEENTAKHLRKLLPLDGQQRLTTFFLLHWYIAQKEKRMVEAKSVLQNFSYTTRVSSREFCNLLVSLDYVPEADEKVSDFIKNENGYFSTWDNDPTIRAMLIMLDAIHEKFFECGLLFDKLISNDPALITFNYLPMNNYFLTDDLYIKMNARGKALSNFENLKAKFIQHLRKNNLPIDRFESNIDGKWINLLWDYRAQDNTVDEQFMNLFCFFTEMIFLYTESPKDCESPFKRNDIRTLVEFYDSADKVNLFYDLMDLWESKDEAQKVLNEYLDVDRKIGKVRIFDGQPDIFSDIVTGERQVLLVHKVLLFSIMFRHIVLGKDTDKEAMLDYIRIVRNLLIQCRYFNNGKCAFVGDFRFGRNGIPNVSFVTRHLATSLKPYAIIEKPYIEAYKGINSETYKHESDKAKLITESAENKLLIQALEDLDVFRGSIFNILDYAVSNTETLLENLENLFIKENSLKIIRALLSFDDYVIDVGRTILGGKYFFGNTDNLYDILTYSGGNAYSDIITLFIKCYQLFDAHTVDEALDGIIEENLKSIDVNDWRYCLVKYPSTLQDVDRVINSKLVFIFEEKHESNAESEKYVLHRMKGKTLNAYHVIPEFIEASRQLGNKCEPDKIFGINSDDLGELRLNCKANSTVAVIVDDDCNPCVVDSERNQEESEIINSAVKKFYTYDPCEMDMVERLVLLSNLLIDGFGGS